MRAVELAKHRLRAGVASLRNGGAPSAGTTAQIEKVADPALAGGIANEKILLVPGATQGNPYSSPRQRKLHTIPHGYFIGAYPDTVSWDETTAAALRAGRDPRIRLYLGFVPDDDEVQLYLNAADVAMLPYHRDVLGRTP